MIPTPSVTGLVLTMKYGRGEERDSMLTKQHFQIDRSRPVTFLEELREKSESGAVSPGSPRWSFETGLPPSEGVVWPAQDSC